MKYLIYKKQKLRYNLEGKGDKVIIFLHGFMEDLTYWKKYSKELSKKYKVISIDLLGHGESENNQEINTMENMADEVNFILQELNLEKGIFVGHSMGGYVGLDFLKKNTEKVEGLVLINSHIFIDIKTKIKQRESLVRLIKEGKKEHLIKISIPNNFFIKNKQEIERVKNMALECEDKNIISTSNGMKNRTDTIDIFFNSKCKKLIIEGKFDKTTDFISLKNEIKNKQNITFIETETGHMTPLEDYENTIKQIKLFINEI